MSLDSASTAAPCPGEDLHPWQALWVPGETFPPRARAGSLAEARWSARSRARVVFELGERRAVARAAWRLFGRRLAAWEFSGLAGAPDDAELRVGRFGGGLSLELSAPATGCYCGVWFVRFRGRRPVLVTDYLSIRKRSMRGKGLGLRMFQRQLEHASAMGVSQIETRAGRIAEENGYYTWPRYGFDGPLPRGVRRRLPPWLRQAYNVLDLMESERGRLWWRQYGSTLRVAFDLAQGSRSWQVFARYLREKTARECAPQVSLAAHWLFAARRRRPT